MGIIKRYIPTLVYDKIQELEYKNKEHLYVICDMIYRSSIYKNEDKDYSNIFMDIPKFYFRDIICDSKNLSMAFDILKRSGVVLSDGIYSKQQGKALGYKFNNSFISKLISVNIEKKTITKRIIINKNQRNNLVKEELKTYRDYYINNFKIDYDSALNYLNNSYNNSISNLNSSYVGEKRNKEWVKIVHKYNHMMISLSAINDGELYFRKNKTNGRIDTNLTSLKSEYKQFIVGGSKLNQIDIVNSQPFILSLYLNSLTPSYVGEKVDNRELRKYTKWTSDGIFYEMMIREYFTISGKLLERDEVKNMMFCVFYSKNGSYRKEKNMFKTIFPSLMEYIEREKNNKHNEFSIKLQKLESGICMDIISQRLDKENIKYFTIHDAWLVSDENLIKTENIILEEFTNKYNYTPKLKIDKIKNK